MAAAGRGWQWLLLAGLLVSPTACIDQAPAGAGPAGKPAAGAGVQAEPWAVPPLPPGVPEIGFHRGLVYGIFSRGGVDFHRRNLEEIRALGVDSIQIVVPRSMANIRATTISDDNPLLTPSRESLVQAVRQAHRLGMRVFLFPILFMDELAEGEWRGELRPADWDAWWIEYESFILEEARWAARHRVEAFSVGSELCSVERYRERWERLIAGVRAVFPGALTYSANWDHLDVIEFGGALDFIGMNAYHEVGSEQPTLSSLASRWRQVLEEVEAWQRRHGRPVMITEVGYPSRAGGTIDPWNHGASGPPAPLEQDLGYRAFMEAWSRQTWLAGVYFYLWWDEEDGGRGYTPRGKPAAESLRRWYTQGASWPDSKEPPAPAAGGSAGAAPVGFSP